MCEICVDTATKCAYYRGIIQYVILFNNTPFPLTARDGSARGSLCLTGATLPRTSRARPVRESHHGTERPAGPGGWSGSTLPLPAIPPWNTRAVALCSAAGRALRRHTWERGTRPRPPGVPERHSARRWLPPTPPSSSPHGDTRGLESRGAPGPLPPHTGERPRDAGARIIRRRERHDPLEACTRTILRI